jgi:ABC-2 type transport system ATP-binding protein
VSKVKEFPMIEIKGITKKFGPKIALQDINFTLKEGDLAALIGENGAGKSTLMRIMCGYLPSNGGDVKIYNHDVEKERLQALQKIGYVPEISTLYGDMRVYDFLFWISQTV